MEQQVYFQKIFLEGSPEKPTSEDLCNCIMDNAWGPVVPQNFDNIMNALLLLFEISTTEGWTAIMYTAFDSRGIGMQPKRYANVVVPMVYFIGFMMIGCFFCIELFVRSIIDNFNKLRDDQGPTAAP